MFTRARLLFLAGLAALLMGGSPCTLWESPHEDVGAALFASPIVDSLALSADGTRLYVAKTLSNEVLVVDTGSGTVTQHILVGIDPVSVELRPDGLELWVANHVSDSISIIDTDPGSGTFHEVTDTIQDLSGGVTGFDEPTDIAFASNSKAYVTLSSTNNVAVIDVGTRAIGTPIHITAQEPRALAVRNGKLYVAAFESGNQSEVSACPEGQSAGEPADNCTLNAIALFNFATNPNLPGETKNIIIDDDLPDRDVFVFDTSDESEVDTLSGVGTLLYGLAVDSSDQLFVAQTEARNTENGIEPANLIDLDNRIFLNQIAVIDCSGGGGCGFNANSDVHDLEEAVGVSVTTPLATPYGIAVSGDDSTLVITAAASSRIATIDATDPSLTGVLDTLDVGAIPRSVELRSDLGGAPLTAYVHNNLDDTISVVDVSTPGSISLSQTISLGSSPIRAEVLAGRIAFNNAEASSSGTFACASCHPDGNTDQLLWRIGGKCDLNNCSGDDEPRTTMPIRGLKNTLPLHWDGTLGDPFGGGNGQVGFLGAGGTDCVPTADDPDGDHDCFRDLVNESLAGVMCEQAAGNPDVCNVTGPSGQLGLLTDTERADMAFFLAGVSYPPARERATDDVLSASADGGFRDFFMNQGGNGNASTNTCADSTGGCHELPLGTATNSSQLNGFDAPTMRGMTDRFLQFSLGPTAAEEVMLLANTGNLFGNQIAPPNPNPYSFADGLEEITVFGSAFLIFDPTYNVGPDDIFQMFEEASTGSSGAVGRQVQLDGPGTDYTLLDTLESADATGLVQLRGPGFRVSEDLPLEISYWAGVDRYQVGPTRMTRAELESEVNSGNLRGMLTAFLPKNYSVHPQPLITPIGNSGPTGDPNLDFADPLVVTGIDVHPSAVVFLDGAPEGGSVSCTAGADGYCDGSVSIDFASGVSNGTHFVQVQNPEGALSNEVPICEGPAGGCL